MKFLSLILISNLFFLDSNSQGRDNIWLYGGIISPIATMDFQSGSPLIYVGHQHMPLEISNANISDTAGHLLFYTNGCYINNANGDTMVNGTGLNPGACTNAYCSHGIPISQADLILPSIGSYNIYYLFHLTCSYNTNNIQPIALYYSIVEMALDSGRGAVISKNNIVLYDTLSFGLLTAVKHANGRDWWIVIPKFNSNTYHILLLSPNGIIQNFTQQIGLSTGQYGGAWQAAFSPDGQRYASYSPNDDVTLMKFDRCNGTFYDYQHISINDSMNAGGVAFSPNSKVLYVSSLVYLYQFDASAANVQGSKITVGVYDGFQSPPPFPTTFYLSQLAPDGKIYINSNSGVDYMHVINFPDSLGLACDLQQHSLFLQVENALTVPNHPNYHLGPILDGPCDSLSTNVINNEKNCNIILSPNPFYDKIIIKLDGGVKENKQPIYMQISNINGIFVEKMIFLKNIFEIDLSQLPVGIYIASITTNQFTYNRKLVKIQ